MKTELQERADILASNLQRSVDACFEVLRSISQLFASSAQVGRQDFQRFVEPVLTRYPSIYALEWLPRLLDRDRSAFEKFIQSEGCSGFQVTEQTSDGKIICAEQRPEYFPVCYVEPLANNTLVLGFDLASDAIRRSALERARDTGAIAVSGRVELVQETRRQFGVLVILPIYQHGMPCATVGDRRQHLQGFVLGVFLLANIVRSSLNGLNLDHIDFHLHDRSSHPDVGPLATYESQSNQVSASPNQAKASPSEKQRLDKSSQRGKAICTRSLTIADRQWSLVLVPTAAYVDRTELYQQSRLRADAAAAEAEQLKKALHNLQQTQARWFLEKNLIAVGVGLVLLILGGANLVSYRNIAHLMESKAGIERSFTVLATLAKVLSLTTDAEPVLQTIPNNATSLTSNVETAQPLPELETLRQAIAHNPHQQQRLSILEPLIAQRLTSLQQAQQRTPPDESAENVSDRQLQQQIRQVIAELEQDERSHLPLWRKRAEESVRSIVFINVTGISLSMALLFGVYYLLQRQMSERQQVEAALYKANSQLEIEVQERMAELAQTKEISELKIRLFSMVSHEFRTPLSTILVSTQLLTNTEQNWSEERKTKNLSRIQSAAKTMAQLLSDILTLGRAEAGKLEFRPESLDLITFCQRLIDEVQTSTESQPRISFACSWNAIEARVDSKLLHSILTNLLSNAIKYSPPDSPIQLTLNCTSDQLIFHIKDQGIGISPDDQQRLYEAFHRGQNVGDRAGTGLGLAVVKTCVELHGGQVTVNSEVGKGTVFTVVLPR